jgi:transcriptional regulator with XRE-family HTH domain
LVTLPSIDLRIADRLKDREFRREWFRAALETDVPEMFRDLREAREMTQIQLAAESGMKQSAISRFESSRDAKWKLETLLTLAEALDAQLLISVVPAEEVIARYEREEAGGGSAQKSVLEAKSLIETWNQSGDLSEQQVRHEYLTALHGAVLGAARAAGRSYMQYGQQQLWNW